MNSNLRFTMSFGLALLFALNTYAQQWAVDSTIYQEPVNNAIAPFKKAVDIQSGLYNGQEYVFYNRQKIDNPFFADQISWNPSALNYNGAFYTDVPVMYDILKDAVIALLYNKVANYILVNQKIIDFTLLNHHFVYRNIDSIASGGLKSGIYDQIYDGKTEVLVKRKKSLYVTQGQKSTFPQSDKLFIKKEEKYFEAGSKSSLLGILKDRRKELRKYINDNSIDFKDNKEAATIKVVLYYDKLTQ